MSFEWVDQWLPKSSRDGFRADADQPDLPDSPNTGSVRESELMQERLDRFMEEQEAADRDGSWTKEDKDAAEQEFEDNYEQISRQDQPVTVRDLEAEINFLDGNGRLVPQDGADGSVLTMQGGVPSFEEGISSVPVPTEDDLFLMSDLSAPGKMVWKDDVWT